MDGHRLPELKPKIYGKYRGIVVVGKDPEGKGRVKVQVPALFGFKTLEHWAYPVLPPELVYTSGSAGGVIDDLHVDAAYTDKEHTSPATPYLSSGNYLVVTRKKLPKIVGADPRDWEIPPGTGVWVEFEGGDPDKPIWCGFWR
jgi:hypothetical protein